MEGIKDLISSDEQLIGQEFDYRGSHNDTKYSVRFRVASRYDHYGAPQVKLQVLSTNSSLYKIGTEYDFTEKSVRGFLDGSPEATLQEHKSNRRLHEVIGDIE